MDEYGFWDILLGLGIFGAALSISIFLGICVAIILVGIHYIEE